MVHMVLSEGWGEGEWGGVPWGSGWVPEVTGDIGVAAIRENVVRVAFSTAILITALFNSKDSLNPSHYSITALEGAGYDGEKIHPVGVIQAAPVTGNPNAVDLYTDRPMSHYPCIYQLRVNDIYSVTGALIVATANAYFSGLKALFVKPVPATFAPSGTRDFANPSGKEALFDPLPVIDDLNLGTFPYGDDGDYGHDEGVENVRKRVIRRGIVRKGGFVWLGGYGAGIPREGKKLNSAARRERIRANYEAQILSEPDIRAAKVSFKFIPDTPGIVWLVIRVVTTADRAFKFDVPVTMQ
jgi:hypothetical protein